MCRAESLAPHGPVQTALLAMLILAPMLMAQGSASGSAFDYVEGVGGGGTRAPDTGGPTVLLPAASLLLGSGILTYAILRRR